MIVSIKHEKDKEPVFTIDDQEYQFTYDSIKSYIDLILNCTEKLEFENDEIDEQYSLLLKEIYKEVNKEDFKTAVENARKSKERLMTAEKAAEEIIDDND